MALIECNNCGRSISDKAIKCPHCGSRNRIQKPINLSGEELKFFYLLKSSGLIYIISLLLWCVGWLINFQSQEAFDSYYSIIRYVSGIAEIVFFLSFCFVQSDRKWVNWTIFGTIAIFIIVLNIWPSFIVLWYTNVVFTIGCLIYYLIILKNQKLKYIVLALLISFLFSYTFNIIGLFDNIILSYELFSLCQWVSVLLFIIFGIMCIMLNKRQIAVNPN